MRNIFKKLDSFIVGVFDTEEGKIDEGTVAKTFKSDVIVLKESESRTLQDLLHKIINREKRYTDLVAQLETQKMRILLEVIRLKKDFDEAHKNILEEYGISLADASLWNLRIPDVGSDEPLTLIKGQQGVKESG